MGATLEATTAGKLASQLITAAMQLGIDGPNIPAGATPYLDISPSGTTLHLHLDEDPETAAAVRAAIPGLAPSSWVEGLLGGDWRGITVRVHLPQEVAA